MKQQTLPNIEIDSWKEFINDHTLISTDTMPDPSDGHWCQACGEDPNITGHPLENDHVISKFDGGHDYTENRQGLCSPCNKAKGTDSYDYRGTWSCPNPFHVTTKKTIKNFHDRRNLNYRRKPKT